MLVAAALAAGAAAQGTTVTLQIERDAWSVLRQRLGVAANGPIAAELRPTLQLHGNGNAVWPAQPMALDDDGACTLTTVPAGEWRIEVAWPLPQPRLGPPRWTQSGGVVTVRGDALRHECALDGPPAIASGQLLLDGAPAVGVPVVAHIDYEVQKLLDRRVLNEVVRAVTDGEGRFRLIGPDGAWSLAAELPRKDGGMEPLTLRAPRALAAGAIANDTFAFATGPLQLRVRCIDGAPLADTDVQLRGPDGAHVVRTDANGRIERERAVAGEHRVLTWRDDLRDERARSAWFAAHPRAPLDEALVELGTVHVPTATPRELRVRAKDARLKVALDAESMANLRAWNGLAAGGEVAPSARPRLGLALFTDLNPLMANATLDANGEGTVVFQWSPYPCCVWYGSIEWTPPATVFAAERTVQESLTVLSWAGRRASLDLSIPAPAILRGRVTFQGEPFANGRLRLLRRSLWQHSAPAVPSAFTTDAHGNYRIAALPGWWELQLVYDRAGRGGEGTVTLLAETAIEPGEVARDFTATK